MHCCSMPSRRSAQRHRSRVRLRVRHRRLRYPVSPSHRLVKLLSMDASSRAARSGATTALCFSTARSSSKMISRPFLSSCGCPATCLRRPLPYGRRSVAFQHRPSWPNCCSTPFDGWRTRLQRCFPARSSMRFDQTHGDRFTPIQHGRGVGDFTLTQASFLTALGR